VANVGCFVQSWIRLHAQTNRIIQRQDIAGSKFTDVSDNEKCLMSTKRCIDKVDDLLSRAGIADLDASSSLIGHCIKMLPKIQL